MTDPTENPMKLVQPTTSGVIVAGNIHTAIAKAMKAAGLTNEALLQWTADPNTKSFTVSKAGDVQ